jgi:ribosomal protein RSM22 (predicted rRNA methylase)
MSNVNWLVSDNPHRAQWVVRQYPRVLKCCDELQFNDPAQALAYLILHLPDRYCRMFQVLERLLLSAKLPLGRSPSFAAIDIGAGPGPGIFAIRSFYTALAHYSVICDPQRSVATLGLTDIVERSRAMPYVMNRFAMALGIIERGYDAPGRPPGPVSPNPCVAELGRSAMPDYVSYDDFTTLDVREEHNRARRAWAAQLYQDEDLTPSEAHWYAYKEPISTPSSYALAVMMNFLTTTDAIPKFEGAIERLMRRSLVPGGTILVLGGVGGKYRDIYLELDRRARAAHLRVLRGFDDLMQAGQLADELEMLCTLTRSVWTKLEVMAGDVELVKEELRALDAADIFDASVPFKLPRFRVRAYRRGG